MAGSLSEHRVDKCDNVRLIWNAKHMPCDLEKQRGVFQCLKLWQKMIHSMLKAYTEELKWMYRCYGGAQVKAYI